MYVNEKIAENKEKMYDLLIRKLRVITDGVDCSLSNLSNISALIYDILPEINWAGFYLMKNGSLLLGPFGGKPACVKIEIGKGVCGTAVAENKTMLIEDVHKFPGHIACDGASNSEIVIPIRQNRKIVGVLDIDSPLLNRFDETDKLNLEKAVEIIEGVCDFNNIF